MMHLMLPSPPSCEQTDTCKNNTFPQLRLRASKTHGFVLFFQLTTRVKSCEPAQLTTVVDGKKQKLNGYQLILEDTVLFPEGGGQVGDQRVPGDAGGHCAVS